MEAEHTPLQSFFARWSSFTYYDTNPAYNEFHRLLGHLQWEADSPPGFLAFSDFRDAFVKQFNMIFGTNEMSLHSWKALFKVIDEPLPQGMHSRREIFRRVNLVDVVDHKYTGRPVQVFRSEHALSEYIKETGKLFPRNSPYAGRLLRFLLAGGMAPSRKPRANPRKDHQLQSYLYRQLCLELLPVRIGKAVRQRKGKEKAKKKAKTQPSKVEVPEPDNARTRLSMSAKVGPGQELKRRSHFQEKKGKSKTILEPKQVSVSPPATDPAPLQTFFANYPKFTYDSSKSASREWHRLCSHSRWPRDAEVRQKAYEGFKDALVKQFNVAYGTDNSLQAWKNLCKVIKVQPIPTSLKDCQEAVRNVNFNLVDLVDSYTTGADVPTFTSTTAHDEYARKSGKFFPYWNANAGPLLKHLLRRTSKRQRE